MSESEEQSWLLKTSSAFATVYMYSAAVVFSVTFLAKIATLVHGGRILAVKDPLWGISNAWTMGCVAAAEVLALGVIFWTRDRWLTGLTGAILGAQFLAYRIIFAQGHFSHGCPCLGKLGDGIPVSQQRLGATLWWIAAWLVAAGIVAMLCAWRNRGHHSARHRVGESLRLKGAELE